LISFKIDPEMIGMVIGPGGKKIKAITEQTGAKVDIADDGTVTIASLEAAKGEKAKALIEAIVFKPSAGDVFPVRWFASFRLEPLWNSCQDKTA
jgi:polyribonucleotide nucleotidyltransferase